MIVWIYVQFEHGVSSFFEKAFIFGWTLYGRRFLAVQTIWIISSSIYVYLSGPQCNFIFKISIFQYFHWFPSIQVFFLAFEDTTLSNIEKYSLVIPVWVGCGNGTFKACFFMIKRKKVRSLLQNMQNNVNRREWLYKLYCKLYYLHS